MSGEPREPRRNPAPPDKLEALYKSAAAGTGTAVQIVGAAAGFYHSFPAPTDIFEHLPLLRELASTCDHVTELGVRDASGSTVALLAGQPETLVSWDLNPGAIVSQGISILLGLAGRTRFEPRVGDSLKVTIEPTDLLFIDTYHTAKQLKAELERHADPMANTVRRYLVFHDTATFGAAGEDGSEPGLRAAIRWFQKNHAFPVWELLEDRQNCNGLVVLRNVRWKG